MTDEQKAEEYSQGNFYSKEGFLYGFELGRKETEENLFEHWCKSEGDECPHLHRLEKENEQLKKQIEKLKCCQNCKYCDCLCENFDQQGETYICDKWEFAE